MNLNYQALHLRRPLPLDNQPQFMREMPFADGRQLRVVLYSHDAMGLGHMRRNLLIARTLSGKPMNANILMIAGSQQLSRFEMPEGVDCLTLPALHKSENGHYQSRYLNVTLEDLIEIRAQAIRAAVASFKPDVFIVDKRPRGVQGELDIALSYLRKNTETRIVLGLRDILDDKQSVDKEWSYSDNSGAINRFYDAVWIYGDKRVFDMVREYDMPDETACKISYTGYLNRAILLENSAADKARILRELGLPDTRLILCMVGGGQDGFQLANSFMRSRLPANAAGLLVTGPFMPESEQEVLKKLARQNPNIRITRFLSEPITMVQAAERIITMGGYNSICEALSLGKRTLVIPRVVPRLEQMIRAERLANLGLLEIQRPDTVNPAVLSAWFRDMTPYPANLADHIDMNGLTRIPELLSELLNRKQHKSPTMKEVV